MENNGQVLGNLLTIWKCEINEKLSVPKYYFFKLTSLLVQAPLPQAQTPLWLRPSKAGLASKSKATTSPTGHGSAWPGL